MFRQHCLVLIKFFFSIKYNGFDNFLWSTNLSQKSFS